MIDENNYTIQSSISYVIVEIANYDYPTEWSDLLSTLASFVNNGSSVSPTLSLNALRVLDTVYEDLKNDLSDSRSILSNDVINIITFLLSKINELSSEYAQPTLSLCCSIIDSAGCSETKAKKKEKKEMMKEFAKRLLCVAEQLLRADNAKDGNYVIKTYSVRV